MRTLRVIRIFTFVAVLFASTLPSVSFADTTEECRVPDSKWSQVSLGFPVRKERLKYSAKPRILVIPFRPSDAPDFSISPTEKANFIQSAKEIYELSSGLSQIEFVFNPTVKLTITTSEMDKFKVNAQQTYLKDFENDQFGFALKLIEDSDQNIDYTGIDSVVLYGVSKKSSQEIASALQYTDDMSFVGNSNKRKDGKPWFAPIITNEKVISNVVLMYNRSEIFVITHELLHNYGLQDLYGAPNIPAGLSRMASATDETLLTYERWVLGWHPEQEVSCLSGNDTNKASKFLFDTKGKEQIALVRPNQSNSMYILETTMVNKKLLFSFYKLTNDNRPPIEYYSYSNGRAGVDLSDLSSMTKSYQGEQYSVLVHSIVDSLATVYMYPNSLASSSEVQRLIAEAKDFRVKSELKAKQEAEAKAAAGLKAKQEADEKAAAELKIKQEAATKEAIELKQRRDVSILNNTFYLDTSSCHPTSMRAELQIMSEGLWKTLSPVLGWELGGKCPAYHPYQPWTIAETEPNSQLRWVFWPNGVETPSGSFRSLISSKAKQEAEAKAAAELKAKQEADAKAAAELKAKQEAEAKAAAELKAKQEADAKAASELKAKQDAEAKAAALAAANKKTTITCFKGKLTKKITAVKPKCPSGYKLKK